MMAVVKMMRMVQITASVTFSPPQVVPPAPPPDPPAMVTAWGEQYQLAKAQKDETLCLGGNLKQSGLTEAPSTRRWWAKGRPGREAAVWAGRPCVLGMRVLCLLQEHVLSCGQLSPVNAPATLIPSSGTSCCDCPGAEWCWLEAASNVRPQSSSMGPFSWQPQSMLVRWFDIRQ